MLHLVIISIFDKNYMTDYNSYNQQQYSSPQGNNQAPNYQNNQGPPPGNYQAPNTYQNNLGTPQNYGYSQ